MLLFISTYFKITFFKIFFQEHYQSVKQFGSTLDQNVGPDLSPNILQRLSSAAGHSQKLLNVEANQEKFGAFRVYCKKKGKKPI